MAGKNPSFPFLFLSFLITTFFISCAPTVRDPMGLALRQGSAPVFAPPESLTVDLDIRLHQKGAPPFSARLYARPHHQYRIDVFGFATQVVASYLWMEGHWKLVLNERGESWEGEGDSLSLDVDGVSLHLPYIHALLGFLWSEPLPGFLGREDPALTWSGDTLRWQTHHTKWEARFNSSTGTCVETHSETLQLRYGPYQRFGDRVVPGEAEVFVDGESRVTLRVKKINDHPAWKKDPFILPVLRKTGIDG